MYSPNFNVERSGPNDSISHANAKGRNEGSSAIHNLSGIRPRRYAHTLFIYRIFSDTRAEQKKISFFVHRAPKMSLFEIKQKMERKKTSTSNIIKTSFARKFNAHPRLRSIVGDINSFQISGDIATKTPGYSPNKSVSGKNSIIYCKAATALHSRKKTNLSDLVRNMKKIEMPVKEDLSTFKSNIKVHLHTIVESKTQTSHTTQANLGNFNSKCICF
jgi:hypothetical protein